MENPQRTVREAYRGGKMAETAVTFLNFQSSLNTSDWLYKKNPGLTRKPLSQNRRQETSVLVRSFQKTDRAAPSSPKQQSKNMAESTGRIYDREFFIF